jgi:mannose-P-dolichol utilization defect protein 1
LPKAACRSQGLGTGILLGSLLVKVPQILKITRGKSARGLSPLSFELETLGLCIVATYGFIMQLPFSAFGEVVVGAWTQPVLMLLVLGEGATSRAHHS